MTPEHDLATLLRSMDPELIDGVFVFVTVPLDRRGQLAQAGSAAAPVSPVEPAASRAEPVASQAEPAALAELSPLMTFREREGLTLILRQEEARAAGLRGTFPCRLITLNVHSALNAVGYLAKIAAVLADAGISVNAVSAFHHDHLFVPSERADEALRLLRQLAAR